MKAFLALALCVIIYTVGVESQIAGGISPADPNDPEFKALIDHGLKNLNAGEAVNETLTLVSINNASRQVVAGSKYVIGSTVSVNNDNKNCVFTIWDRPWLPNGREFDIACDHKKFKTFAVNSQ